MDEGTGDILKKIIITGASGFIGYYVLNKMLSNNIEVIAVVREKSKNINKLLDKNITIIECNLENYTKLPSLIEDRDTDVIYHFAWQGSSDDDLKNEMVQIKNLKATLDLVDAAHEMGINTFIGAGSVHEYEVITEMNNNKVVTNLGVMYKSAKLAAHYMAKAKAGNLGMRFFWPIVTNSYGAGEKSGRLINTIIRSIYAGEIPALTEGLQNYDFVHVEDVANAFYLIGEKGINGANYTISSGKVKPLKEYLQQVANITNELNNSSIELGFGRIKSDVVFLSAESFDISRLSKDTGYEPSISFEEGIKDTARWILDSNVNSAR